MEKLRLRIDNPCHESWTGMHANNDGRFCNACQKTVVDFTQMSDAQLVEWFARKTEEKTCGRMNDDQLNRVLAAPPQSRKLPWPQLWRLLLTGWLISSEACSSPTMGEPIIDAPAMTPLNPKPIIGDTIMAPIPEILKGQIVDDKNMPIPAVSIMYAKGAGTITDAQGMFSIETKNLGKAQTLTLSSVGYITKTIRIDTILTQSGGPVITLKPIGLEMQVMGDVVIVAKPRRKKLPSILKDTLAAVGLCEKSLSVYPNPVVRGAAVTLSMRLDAPGAYTAQLFNTAGALIESLQIEGSSLSSKRSHTELMNIPSTLTPGSYFVRLTHPSLKKPYTQQIIVQ